MKKIVENIEKEIAELKKTVEDWEEQADLSILKMAKRNLADAYDWMTLLSERIDKTCQQLEVEPSMTTVSPETKLAVEVLEEPKDLTSVKEERNPTDQMMENKTEDIKEDSEEKRESVLKSVKTIHISLSATACHSEKKQEDKKVDVKSMKTEYLLSQSYEEKAKKEQKNGDAINETPILGEHLLKMEDGMYASLSLNDSIRFSRAWFDEDNKELKQFLKTIEDTNSLEEGINVAKQRLNADAESEEWLALVEMMDKYFND